ncbi:NYN domain-containing protein [Candidatus Borrarchaeum sp.]|uniref:NYN domain-containing protein n=1 Tax=Candidatus Borrarchaeum sp. TaxID=2846742 RepID=UPI00257B9E0C|nr:NYN domain-containing protein [Candidatus Borrarchaeum sp.]
MSDENVAIYLDFENLALSAEEVYPSKEKPLSLGPLVDFATSKGNICIKRAYADWSKHIFAQYQRSLMEHGFEMIHLPATTSQGKNGSDVRLAIDAMENLELFKIINIIIICSGDTDFIPLIQRILARGKKVIVLGFEHSVGPLIKSSGTEFKSIDEILGAPEKDSLSSDLTEEMNISLGKDLMIRYIKSKSDDEPVLMAKLKQDLLRLDPSFSEKRLGFRSFKDFVESFIGEIVEKIDLTDQQPKIYFAEMELPEVQPVDLKADAKSFLKKNLRYINDSSQRLKLFTILFEVFRKNLSMSMHQMIDILFNDTNEIPKITIRKFINTLFTGNTFISSEKEMGGPLLSRPFRLKETIKNPAGLEIFYMSRIVEILNNRFPDLSDDEITEIVYENHINV